jgi:uncharacterized protein
MLLVDLRDLQRGPVETNDQLSPDDPAFEGLAVELDGPLAIRGRLQATGDGDFFWHAHLSGRIRGTCRRCLKDLTEPLDADVDVLFSADPDAADDPSVYALTEPLTKVDVRVAVREELALAAPAFFLCRDDCAGLCRFCGADLNAGPCGCAGPAEPV